MVMWRLECDWACIDLWSSLILPWRQHCQTLAALAQDQTWNLLTIFSLFSFYLWIYTALWIVLLIRILILF